VANYDIDNYIDMVYRFVEIDQRTSDSYKMSTTILLDTNTKR
jgi:hypothetical protein